MISSSAITASPTLLYSLYTHVAHEGGFPLGAFPKIKAWIERVKEQPRFAPMK